MTGTLVIGPAWIGDMVRAQPVPAPEGRRARNRLAVAAPPWTLPLLRFMPEVDAAFALPFAHGALKLLERRRIGQDLARQGFDRAILLPNSLKSALVPWFAGIPQRIGYAGEGR